MKSNITYIIVSLVSIILGATGGYILFGGGHEHDGSPSQASGSKVTEQDKGELWTCSMHPQVRQNEPGVCPICEMDLIPLTSSPSTDPLVFEMTREAVALANVQTTIVGAGEQRDIKSIRLSGKVKADERRASTQVAHVPGRIEKLYITFTGEEVNKGQKLADIYSPQLITAQRELLEASKLKEVNPGLLKASRNKLRLWKIPIETIEEIESSGVIREIFTLRADEPGRVLKRRVATGDYVEQGEPMFELIDLGRVWVLFDAYEKDLPDISLGNLITFTTPSAPNRTYRTRITFIDPVIDPETRVASVRAEVNNTAGLLKPEMLVYGNLEKAPGPDVQLTVPKSSVLWTGRRSVVYVKLAGREIPSYAFREVEIGESIGNNYEIISGLTVGEEVVTNGTFSIDAAAQLNNQASMMNRDIQLKEEQTAGLPDFTSSVPDAFQEQLYGVVSKYMSLKNALVETDPQKASGVASEVEASLEQVDMSVLDEEAHEFWMEKLRAMKAHSQQIASTKAVENQRRQFSFLSSALIETIQAFGVPEDTIYVQYCPMALDNEGADWLAEEENIRNPYFGDRMLKCGTVKRKFN